MDLGEAIRAAARCHAGLSNFIDDDNIDEEEEVEKGPGAAPASPPGSVAEQDVALAATEQPCSAAPVKGERTHAIAGCQPGNSNREHRRASPELDDLEVADEVAPPAKKRRLRKAGSEGAARPSGAAGAAPAGGAGPGSTGRRASTRPRMERRDPKLRILEHQVAPPGSTLLVFPAGVLVLQPCFLVCVCKLHMVRVCLPVRLPLQAAVRAGSTPERRALFPDCEDDEDGAAPAPVNAGIIHSTAKFLNHATAGYPSCHVAQQRCLLWWKPLLFGAVVSLPRADSGSSTGQSGGELSDDLTEVRPEGAGAPGVEEGADGSLDAEDSEMKKFIVQDDPAEAAEGCVACGLVGSCILHSFSSCLTPCAWLLRAGQYMLGPDPRSVV